MNKGILILAMLVALLACRPSVSVAEGKVKPCMVIGQVKDFLTHVLIEGAKVTLLTKDGVPVDSGRTSKNQTSGNLTNVYWVTAKTCDMPDMLLQVEADGYETALVTLPAMNVHGRGSTGIRYAEDVLLKRQPKTVDLKGVEVKATKIKFYHKGDTLVILEDAEYRLALAQAEAGRGAQGRRTDLCQRQVCGESAAQRRELLLQGP